MPANGSLYRCRSSRPLLAVGSICLSLFAVSALFSTSQGPSWQDMVPWPNSLFPRSNLVHVFKGIVKMEGFSRLKNSPTRRVVDWLNKETYTCRDERMVGSAFMPACFDRPLTLPRNRTEGDGCLVYSFGLAPDWSFEHTLAGRGCEVHVFEAHEKEPQAMPFSGVHFHSSVELGLQREGGSMAFETKKLDDIKYDLGHEGRTIQFIRMNAFTEFQFAVLLGVQLSSREGDMVLDQVEQISALVKLPSDPAHGRQTTWVFDYLAEDLHRLNELGYRLAKSVPAGDAKYVYPGVEEPVPALYFVLLVRTGRDIWDRMTRDINPQLQELPSQ